MTSKLLLFSPNTKDPKAIPIRLKLPKIQASLSHIYPQEMPYSEDDFQAANGKHADSHP